MSLMEELRHSYKAAKEKEADALAKKKEAEMKLFRDKMSGWLSNIMEACREAAKEGNPCLTLQEGSVLLPPDPVKWPAHINHFNEVFEGTGLTMKLIYTGKWDSISYVCVSGWATQ
jgi:hypothetical protein